MVDKSVNLALAIFIMMYALTECVGWICFMIGVILSLTTPIIYGALMWIGFGLVVGGALLRCLFSIILKLLD